MSNPDPREIVVASGTLWVAPLGTELPVFNGALEAPWAKVGSNGDLNYDENTGIELTFGEELKEFIPLGSNFPYKQFRTKEVSGIKVAVVDATLEQLMLAFNGNPVTTVAAAPGVPGYKKLGVEKGPNVTSYAFVLRYNESAYMEEGVSEFRHTRVQQRGQPRLVSKKGEPWMFELEFVPQLDPTLAQYERVGVILEQNTEAGT